MWRTTGGGQDWPDKRELLYESDAVLKAQTDVLERRLGAQNAVATCPQWHDQLEDKDFAAEGSLITARRAGCADMSVRRHGAVGIGGWQQTVCPLNTNANNVVRTARSVCAPRHQAFMNQTRRGTGTSPDVARRRPGL